MLRAKKNSVILIAVFLAILFLFSNFAYAVNETLTSRVQVSQPTGKFLRIVYWLNRTAPDNVIDFSLGAAGDSLPGKNSWLDDDGWTSLDANVGFNVIAVGPQGSALNIKCGKMTDGAGHEIPYFYQDPTNPAIRSDYFGFSALSIPDATYLAGSLTSMQVHSLIGWTYVFPPSVFGKEIGVYNSLKIPANTVPGSYATTGTGNNVHLTISLL